jgi:hypothetical protein
VYRRRQAYKIIFIRIRTTDKEVIYEQEDTWTAQLCRHEEIIYAEALKDGEFRLSHLKILQKWG